MPAGLAALARGLFHLIQTGTCAGGGPPGIAQECPEGTGTKATAPTLGVVVALLGGLVGVGMAVVPLIFMTVDGTSIALAHPGDVPEGMGAFPDRVKTPLFGARGAPAAAHPAPVPLTPVAAPPENHRHLRGWSSSNARRSLKRAAPSQAPTTSG